VITAADADAPRISASGRIALAGDWLAGARVEDAWLSGRMAIERLAAVAA
jgi:predicted NAD/FAD-dependent oxidoreductase